MTAARSTVAHPAVTRVVDYEPQVGAAPEVPRSRSHRAPPLRVVTPPATGGPSTRFREAAAFADAALRTVLEVIDRRRPPAQLRPLMPSGLADSVTARAAAGAGGRAAAVLRATRVQACDRSEDAFEVAAAFSRHTRWHAVACRVERCGTRWQVVALHIG
ncbi:Rv3235 family protein [Mycobacterium sp. ACS4331]|uniref:Rv3235 family protein n=1 Tax=Mycobacterium sp. ACS4331 TaxID=1834121 RepID=UPI001E5D064B|nr:Rv3235 family protein [Mycobacterium sp. ACS4331]